MKIQFLGLLKWDKDAVLDKSTVTETTQNDFRIYNQCEDGGIIFFCWFDQQSEILFGHNEKTKQYARLMKRESTSFQSEENIHSSGSKWHCWTGGVKVAFAIFTLRVLWEKTAQGCRLNANYPWMSHERDNADEAPYLTIIHLLSIQPHRDTSVTITSQSPNIREEEGSFYPTHWLFVRRWTLPLAYFAQHCTHTNTETHKYHPESPVI